MAIRCETCDKPVHEQVVVCPHCAGPTGAPADPIAEIEIATMPEPPKPQSVVEQLPLDRVAENAEATCLPRAIARPKRR